jgi:hypothetical protein
MNKYGNIEEFKEEKLSKTAKKESMENRQEDSTKRDSQSKDAVDILLKEKH